VASFGLAEAEHVAYATPVLSPASENEPSVLFLPPVCRQLLTR
jgi:hypothetical protein